MLKCVIEYGRIYVASSNLSISVAPLPRAKIHPPVVTSERDVTEITCSADFPAVSSDVTARVTWFQTGSVKPVRDSQWMKLQPEVVSGVYLAVYRANAVRDLALLPRSLNSTNNTLVRILYKDIYVC